MKIDWQKIKKDLLKGLNKREKDVIERRFGLGKKKKETLESIGKSYGVCRERVRQIEARALEEIQERIKQPLYQNVLKKVKDFLKKKKGVSQKDLLLSEISPGSENYLFLIIKASGDINLFRENESFFSFFYLSERDRKNLEESLKKITNFLKKKGVPLSLKELFEMAKKELGISKKEILLNYLSISKLIDKGPHGLFGLKDWPEISPKGVKDKAYLVLKIKKNPLHFREIAELINNLKLEKPLSEKKVVSATVHNELIRDSRFVLVGRGIYALREWGYEPGFVKDIISRIIKEAGKPLPKEEIVKKVLAQRLVKENTILLNLNNKNYFLKDKEGKYTIREV